MYRYLRVGITCLGIFVRILARVVLQRIVAWSLAGKQREGVWWHFRLVEADISQHGIVGIELQGTVETELFFIYPIGNTVQHAVQFAVFRHLRFAVAIQELHQEDVIVADKCHQIAVRWEYRSLLRAAVREFFYDIVGSNPFIVPFHRIQIVDCRIRVTVDRGCFRCNQNFWSVRWKLIAVEFLERTFASFGHIEYHFHRFTRAEGIFHDLCAFGISLCVVFAVRHGNHTIDVFGTELAWVDLFQVERFASLCEAGKAAQTEKQKNEFSFHWL